MIKSITFPERYDLLLEKKSQKRFPHRRVVPKKFDRETKPYIMFDLFPKGLVIEFNEGVNIIVGENGSGKSTLLSLMKTYRGIPYADLFDLNKEYRDEADYLARYQADCKSYIEVNGNLTYKNSVFFNGEKDNPLVAIPQMINPNTDDFISLSTQLFLASEESHGESMLPALDYILDNAKGGYIICMDEPETALSLGNQIRLANKIKKSAKKFGNQLLISTHSLAVINEFNTIFDMETREWLNREEYIKKNYETKT